MNKWKPITIKELNELIANSESKMSESEIKFWNAIKITPEKWQEEQFGSDGDGFWVVAIMGKTVLYYNDIEDGFISSDFTTFGCIDSYVCEQIELVDVIRPFVGSICA